MSLRLSNALIISIHALLAESDILSCRYFGQVTNFYPRSPCGERRVHCAHTNCPPWISIHALLAESDFLRGDPAILLPISIHALLAESDGLQAHQGQKAQDISIHALLAESDTLHAAAVTQFCNFYPRSPCGERLVMHSKIFAEYQFLSTLSLRRATGI